MSRMTPAQRHYEKAMAKKSEKENTSGNFEKGSAYELIMAKLHSDVQRLKQIQSIELKIKAKKEILPDYQPWVDGVLESGKGAQDAVLMTILVWHIDVGNYDDAFRIAEYAKQNDLVMPDQYSRDLATVLLDEISGAMLKQKFDTPEAIEDALSVLKKTEELTASRDAPDQARAKLCKALAQALLAKIGDGDITAENKEAALEAKAYLNRALELDERSGVKAELKRLEKRLEPVSQG